MDLQAAKQVQVVVAQEEMLAMQVMVVEHYLVHQHHKDLKEVMVQEELERIIQDHALCHLVGVVKEHFVLFGQEVQEDGPIQVFVTDLKMNLYIKIKDGQPVDDPYLEENLYQTIEHFNPDNLPDGWAKFIRVCNTHGIIMYNEKITHSYTFDSANNAWTDTWSIEILTDEELELKKDNHKTITVDKFQPHMDYANNMIDNFTFGDKLSEHNKSVWQTYLKILNEHLEKFHNSLDSEDYSIHDSPMPLPVKHPNNDERWIIAPPPLDQSMAEMSQLDRETEQYLRSKINNLGVTRL
jgi:hypothetical protein